MNKQTTANSNINEEKVSFVLIKQKTNCYQLFLYACIKVKKRNQEKVTRKITMYNQLLFCACEILSYLKFYN